MIHGSDLRDLTVRLSEGLLRAAHVLRERGERELYQLLLIEGNQVEVHLNPSVAVNTAKVVGELTAVTDAGLCLAYYDESVSHEALLRLVPYSSILCVIELPPAETDE